MCESNHPISSHARTQLDVEVHSLPQGSRELVLLRYTSNVDFPTKISCSLYEIKKNNISL